MLKLKIQPIKVIGFGNASIYEYRLKNKYIYWKKKSKTIYDCDLASNNANSYELWMKRRREIKINEDPYLTPK
jgi:hypothetical protein